MLFDLIDLFERPGSYVCIWRDGELYVEPFAAAPKPTAANTPWPSSEGDNLIAA